MRPRIAETAKTLWLIYYYNCLCGGFMPEWICHFSQLFNHCYRWVSTHDASIGYFNSPAINTIIGIFLIISGCFGLHFAGLGIYPEFRMFISFQFVLVVICTLVLMFHSVYSSFVKRLTKPSSRLFQWQRRLVLQRIAFQDGSFLTNASIMCCICWGCAGSTGGGLKVIVSCYFSYKVHVS